MALTPEQQERLRLLEAKGSSQSVSGNVPSTTNLPVSDISTTESAMRGGLGGATFNFNDEIGGGIRASGQALTDVLYGNNSGSFGENYRGYRDEIRQNDLRAKIQNPKAYIGGELAGGILPMLVPGAQGISAGKLAAAGGAYGLGSSTSDLTKGDVGGSALDAGIGATAGVAIGKAAPYAISGAKKVIGPVLDKVKSGAASIGKKAISSIFGPTEEAIDALLANPSKIENAKSYADLAEDMPKTLTAIKEQIGKFDTEAWKTLKSTHDPEHGAIPKSQITKILNQVKNDPQVTGGGTFGKATKNAVRTIEDLVDDIDAVGSKVKGNVKSEMGVPSILKNKDFLSEKQLKELIQAADQNIRYDDPAAGPANAALKSIRAELDGLLKGLNDDYRIAMEPVSKRVNLLEKLKRNFNVKEETGKGLVPTDATPGKIQFAPKESKIATQDTLDELKQLTGRDYIDESKTYGLAQQFKGGSPSGSKNVNQFQNYGAGGGAALGASIGGWPGAGIGSLAGGMIGNTMGGYVDKKGGEMAGKIVLWFARNQPQKLGKYASVFQKAAESGAGASQAAIIPHLTLMNSDPEYQAMVDRLVQESNRNLPMLNR